MSKKTGKVSKEVKEVVSSYATRDVVLGKIRGYPPWPGYVVDPDTVPEDVALERPSSKKTSFYCVQFFPTGDYAWLVPKDISKLQKHEIESYIAEPFKKSADLLAGYRIALDPSKWEEERAKAVSERRLAEDNAEIDQLVESAGEEGGEGMDEDGEGGKRKVGKKRKREVESAAGGVGKKKKEPKETKEKKKKEKSASVGATKTSSSAAGKKGAKSKAKVIESEDENDQAEADAEADEEEDHLASTTATATGGANKKSLPSPPPTKKAKRDKTEDEGEDSKLTGDPEATKVRDWRHKLQKSFLGKSVPKEDDLDALDKIFNTIESYNGMTVEYLTFSKIGKVMRHIAVLGDEKIPPREEEFKFRDRAKALVDKWHQILNANKPATANGNGNGPKSETEKDVADATAAIDLNGKVEGGGGGASPSAEAEGEAEAEADGEIDTDNMGDVSMLTENVGDVSMAVVESQEA